MFSLYFELLMEELQMGLALKKENEKYTYGDYKYWNDERYELINGEIYNMSPAPRRIHQKISGTLFALFHTYLKSKPCEVYNAPFDVRLPEYENQHDDTIESVVQPDIVVICDKNKLDEFGCKGAPDIVIEILSPATSKKDLTEKFYLYEKHKVKEYWIVYPYEQVLHIYLLQPDGKYDKSKIYTIDDTCTVHLFEDMTIDMREVFGE